VKKYDLFGSDPKGLYMLDSELGTACIRPHPLCFNADEERPALREDRNQARDGTCRAPSLFCIRSRVAQPML
jgi:hypothetical protein